LLFKTLSLLNGSNFITHVNKLYSYSDVQIQPYRHTMDYHWSKLDNTQAIMWNNRHSFFGRLWSVHNQQAFESFLFIFHAREQSTKFCSPKLFHVQFHQNFLLSMLVWYQLYVTSLLYGSYIYLPYVVVNYACDYKYRSIKFIFTPETILNNYWGEFSLIQLANASVYNLQHNHLCT